MRSVGSLTEARPGPRRLKSSVGLDDLTKTEERLWIDEHVEAVTLRFLDLPSAGQQAKVLGWPRVGAVDCWKTIDRPDQVDVRRTKACRHIDGCAGFERAKAYC